jgi:hypothetical protein
MTDLDLNVPHGYRLESGTNILELAERLRTTMAPIRNRIEIEQVAEFAAKFLDAADLAGTPRPASVIFDAVQAQALHVGQILSGEHSCALPIVSVAVSDDPETGELYALMFFRHEAFGTALDEMEIGTYYPYWNEEDVEDRRPVGVSAAEWERRAQVWERVLRGADPHNPHSMFQIKVGSPFPGMDLVTHATEVFAAMPNHDQRVHHALHELHSSQEFHSPSEVMAFAASMPEHQERIENSLKPITLEDIAGGAR